MIGKAELLRWVNTLDDESCIGIDDGGLTLCEVLPDDTTGEAYIEIGGLPEDDPLARAECDAAAEEDDYRPS
jgi:hypothetical protein